MKTVIKITLATVALIFAALLIFMILLITNTVDLFKDPIEKTGECGDFKYKLVEYKDSSKSYIALDGLTEEGKTKETLIVPYEINGYPVEVLSSGINWFSSRSGYDYGFLVSDSLKTIYILPSGIEVSAQETFLDCPNLEKIVYVNQKGKFSADLKDDQFVYARSGRGKYHTNILYFYNDSRTENDGCYWADYVPYGTRITDIPENPTREGYTFGGWYRDMVCEHKWNFETDALPEVNYDKEGNELYQETRLYAKWIKE